MCNLSYGLPLLAFGGGGVGSGGVYIGEVKKGRQQKRRSEQTQAEEEKKKIVNGMKEEISI
jgi:hypothetical protein